MLGRAAMGKLTQPYGQRAEQTRTLVTRGWRDARTRATGALTRFRRDLARPQPVDIERASGSRDDSP